MPHPIQLITHLFEVLRYTNRTKLVFITGRSEYEAQDFTVTFEEDLTFGEHFSCECKKPKEMPWHTGFETAHDFITSHLPDNVWICSICIEDEHRNRSTLFYNIGRTESYP